MQIKLHNTATRKTETFTPITENEVSIYTCGPTVYDYPHIGNWASFIHWDTLVRLFGVAGYSVNRVMNITDVGHLVNDEDTGEDKIQKGARRENATAWDVARKYANDFLDGMKLLNNTEPTKIIKATDFIPQQLDLVRTLKQKGHTYQIADGIYFDTSTFSRYAEFAHLDLAQQQAGARVERQAGLRNPSDFAIWKFTQPGEVRDMEWETPIDLLEEESYDVSLDVIQGRREDQTKPYLTYGAGGPKHTDTEARQADVVRMGFPGWHLECSAIVLNTLGTTIDIHTGGIDHIPIHHTNEIAQSEAATGKTFAHYWLHTNFIKIDGTKVSKSLGNFYTLHDLQDKGYDPLDYRMYVLQSNYQNEGNFTFDNLDAAKTRRLHWRNIAALRHQTHVTHPASTTHAPVPALPVLQKITEAIADNLNTPRALQEIDDIFGKVDNTPLNHLHHSNLVQLIEHIDELLGLKLIPTTPDISDEHKQLILQRNHARSAKDWATSDSIRDTLLRQGIALRDTPDSTVWGYAPAH